MASKKGSKLDIRFMCHYAGVSRSGYYAYIKRLNRISEKDIQDEYDFKMIKAAYDYKNWRKGAKQIKMRIERDFGVVMNLKKIRRLMKKYDLICPIRKVNPAKVIMKAQQTNKIYGNIVNRQFNQGKAKKVILTDITYITYGNGKRASFITDKS